MEYLIGVGLFLLTLGGLVLFFIFYQPLWENTTREPFTYILRRHRARFSFIILIGIAAAGGLIYLSLPRAWPWFTWVVLAIAFLWLFIGHIFWAGIRWGRIHAATAWRCVEEIRLIADQLRRVPSGKEWSSLPRSWEDAWRRLRFPFVRQTGQASRGVSLMFSALIVLAST